MLFRVLKDEMDRSVRRLRLEKYGGPYYLEYTVRDVDSLEVEASFGALTGRGRSRRRSLAVDLRVGEYSLDSSNFSRGGFDFGGLLGFAPGMGGGAVTVDDDYDALRHAVWLRTDAAYKSAIENLEAKKGYLQENTVQDRPDDLSREEPVVAIAPAIKLEVDAERWARTVRKLSGIFREYPRIQKSVVRFSGEATQRWFVNNEGFRNREGNVEMAVVALASAQADDGMRLGDMEAIAAATEKDFPADADLEKAIRGLADRLTKLAAAPAADEYRGPILLEGQAAAEFFAQTLAPSLGNSHEPIGKSNPMLAALGNPLKEKIGQRILPAFVTVIDDPTARRFDGRPLFGGFDVDDDGVKAQKITLVEKGLLKTFCMSRIPTRHIAHSNGHSSSGTGSPSILFVESDSKLGAKELRDRLFELGRDEGLSSVLVARRLSNLLSSALNPQSLMSSMMSRMSGGGGISLLPPILLYRVGISDGKEELVRGARFSNVTLRALRDIEATGSDAREYAVVRGMQGVASLVTPSILLKEIEVQKPGKETEKPPALQNPFFEKK